MVTGGQVTDARAYFPHNSCPLVSTDYWQRSFAESSHHGKVGMAQPGSPDFYEHFALSGSLKFHLIDLERLAFGVRGSKALLIHNGRCHLHR
ncbi:hypothetical protein GCM10023063_36420 [Arthrobacter methylotrophus]